MAALGAVVGDTALISTVRGRAAAGEPGKAGEMEREDVEARRRAQERARWRRERAVVIARRTAAARADIAAMLAARRRVRTAPAGDV